MKILLTLILIVFFISDSAMAQSGNGSISNQESEKTVKTEQEAEAASTEAVKLFKQQRFDKALLFADKAIKLSLQEYGARHLKTAHAYINLGYIQVGRDKEQAAIKAFEEALSILDQKTDLNKSESLTLAGVLESLAVLKFAAGKDGGAEKHLKKALELREKFNGPEAAETADTLLSLGNLNASAGDHNEAAVYYRRAFDIRLKKLAENHFEAYDALQRCRCSLIKVGKRAEADALQEQLTTLKSPNSINSALPITAGVVNGQALKLVQPRFPQIPVKDRVQQMVTVRVLIDETGKVIFACGADNAKAHPALINATEQAAYSSTFSPTLLNNQPVKVTGMIRYSFIK